jgi:hypothetical protein
MILDGARADPGAGGGKKMMRKLVLCGAVLVMTAGCAARQRVATPAVAPAPRVAEPPPPPPRKIKLAILPVEKLLSPKVADALNERLRGATVSGVSETTTATISMEVAAMQLDCTQATNQCYGQIAKHFEADRLLWADIERARGKKRKAPTTIRIFLFDVDRSEVVGRAEQTFTGPVSNQALDELVNKVLGAGVASAAPASQP